jgi:uncharacterized protein YfaT (DUF1175 family)
VDREALVSVLLFVAVSLGVLVAMRALTTACEADVNGEHEDVHETEDTDVGRRWFLRCVNCGRCTRGVPITWIRTRTWPSVKRVA